MDSLKWVFCNHCSTKFTPTMKFFLSECGHIYCKRCLMTSQIEQNLSAKFSCKLCKRTVDVMELCAKVDMNTQMFFWPVENIIEKCLKIFNFQAMHRSLLTDVLFKKYNFAKKECVRFHIANKKLQNEAHNLRQTLHSMGINDNINNNPFSSSTPTLMNTPNIGNNTMDNMSLLSTVRTSSTPGMAKRIVPENLRNSTLSYRYDCQQVPGSVDQSMRSEHSSFQRNSFRDPAPIHSNNSFRRHVVVPNYLDKYQRKF